MVRIRLRRMGAKKKPFYRIVVANKQSPRDGRFIEVVGTYNPRTEPETIELKADRIAHWLSVGAQPSESVGRMLRKFNLLDENGKPVPVAEGEEVTQSTDTTETVESVEPAEAVESVEGESVESTESAAA